MKLLALFLFALPVFAASASEPADSAAPSDISPAAEEAPAAAPPEEPQREEVGADV